MILPAHIGEFRILREIGRGGMGVVYEAEQPSLHRRVALKVLPEMAAHDPRATARFHREAVTAAQLEHPFVVRIYEAGTSDGRPWIAMELVDGISLEAHLAGPEDAERDTAVSPLPEGSFAVEFSGEDNRTVSLDATVTPPASGSSAPVAPRAPGSSESGSGREPVRLACPRRETSTRRHGTLCRELVRMIAEAAEGVQAAHELGILHRDIKPQNVLVTRSGRAKVADFGLARRPGEETLTATGQIVGTPLYMSPEQLSGKAADERSDVYSLGVTLYRALCGQPPFHADSVQGIIAQILRRDPLPPRHRDPRIPRDLETVCLRAMARHPEDRYATAGAFAEDLRRHLAGEAVLATRAGLLRRAWLRARRNPRLALASATVFILLVIALGLGLGLRKEAAQRRERESLDLVARGVMTAMLGESDEALTLFRQARDMDEGNVLAAVQCAIGNLARGDGAAVEFCLDRAERVERGHPMLRRTRALWQRELGAERPLDPWPPVADVASPLELDSLAMLADTAGDHLRAHDYFEEARRREPNRLGSVVGQARSAMYLGRFEEARRDFELVLQLVPDRTSLHLQLMVATLLQMENVSAADAARLAQRTLELVPAEKPEGEAASLFALMRVLLVTRGRGEQVADGVLLPLVNRLLEGADGDSLHLPISFTQELASLLLRDSHPHLATRLARQALLNSPRARLADLVLAGHAEAQGRTEEALALFERAHRHLPRTALLLKAILAQDLRTEAARPDGSALPSSPTLARGLLETRPDDPRLLAMGARVLDLAGDAPGTRELARWARERFEHSSPPGSEVARKEVEDLLARPEAPPTELPQRKAP